MARKTTTLPGKTTPKATPASVAAKPAKPIPAPVKAMPRATAAGAKALRKTPAAKVPGSARLAPAKAKLSMPKPETVTLKHLASEISESEGLSKPDAEAFAAAFVQTMVRRLTSGAKLRIAGLGVIEVKHRPARMARNSRTGEPVQVEASRKVVLRAAKELREAL